MNPLNVKSTMLQSLLDRIAPHYCLSCEEIGSILCESCKYDITSEQFDGCLFCGRPSLVGVCNNCNTSCSQAWCGGERSGSLEKLINAYKFENAEMAHIALGDILLAALPQMPSETIVVPIPTVQSHVRQRGYDHAYLLARYVAQKQSIALQKVLRRRTKTVQRGASRRERFRQAKEAFEVSHDISGEIPYLLIDDVVTTGATMQSAAAVLRSAGASIVWAAAATRQPLD